MTEKELIYMGIGFVGGILFVSVFWLAYCEDLKAEVSRLKFFIKKYITG